MKWSDNPARCIVQLLEDAEIPLSVHEIAYFDKMALHCEELVCARCGKNLGPGQCGLEMAHPLCQCRDKEVLL